jgi:hypothetical protein
VTPPWPASADEGRHPPAAHPGWEESWALDFATVDGSLGGVVRLGLLPEQGRSRVWACLVGEGRRLVTMVEPDAPLPRAGSLDLRCEGLWVDLVCETPLTHWSVGLEAFGVALDEPADAYRGLRGERIGLGLDLEWETTGPVARTGPGPAGGEGAYLVPCEVHGEVLVGAEVLTFEGWGTRRHTWGVAGWWGEPWSAAAGRLDDGTRWYAEVLGDAGAGAAGAAVRAGDDGASQPEGLPSRASVAVGELALQLEPLHPAPVPDPSPDGGPGRLALALCRTTAGDGRRGAAWAAWNQPG